MTSYLEITLKNLGVPRSTISFREEQVFNFASEAHGPQRRKYTKERYIVHPLRVGISAKKLGIPLGMEIALLHDVLEDTDKGLGAITYMLFQNGYYKNEVEIIVDSVLGLTDVFTHSAFPNLNRASRKEMESDRLSKCSSKVQNIKILDILDNMQSICLFDQKFARVFLPEVFHLGSKLTKADFSLSTILLSVITKEMSKLPEHKKS